MSKIDQLEQRMSDLEEKLGAIADQVVDAVNRLAERAVANALAKANPPQEGKKERRD